MAVEAGVGELGSHWAEARAELQRDAFAYYLPTEHSVQDGNKCQLLKDGVEAFPSMLAALRAAKRYIRLETYMFIDDAVGELFGRTLVEAAQRGVRVTVLYDALGSLSLSRSFVESLEQGGVEIRAFKPLGRIWPFSAILRRTHRKILVVDGEVAFIGGVNIAAQWAPTIEKGGGWRDDVMRIEGPSVRLIERRFRASWWLQSRRRLRQWRRANLEYLKPNRGTTALSVLGTRRSIHRAYLHAIGRAMTSVLIAAAYFVPDRKLLGELKAAALRGVEVTLILPGKSDHPWVKFASRALYEKMMGWGVKIFEWNECVLHSKTAVVDGTWGTVGSFNLEAMSLRFNYECNVVFADKSWGETLEKSLREDCGRCSPIDPVAWKQRPLWHRALEKVCWFFRRIL